MAYVQHAVERTKEDCRYNEEIHRLDTVSMVAKKRLPTRDGGALLRARVLGHTGLADLDAQLEKLAMDFVALPHNGLARLIWRINRRISNGTAGRSPFHQSAQTQHRAAASPDSQSTASRMGFATGTAAARRGESESIA